MPDWDELGAALERIEILEENAEEVDLCFTAMQRSFEQELARWSASPDCRLLERPALDILMAAFRYSVEQIDRRGWNRWNEFSRLQINGRFYAVSMQVAEIRGEDGETPLVTPRRDGPASDA